MAKRGANAPAQPPRYAPALIPLLVAIDSIRPHPDNDRDGDVGAVCESLLRFGQKKPVVVQRSTGYVAAGNTTWKAIKALGWPRIAASIEDMDDAEARAYMVADNRTQELGTYDQERHLALLTSLAQADNLAGTGYDGDDIDALLAEVARPDAPGAPAANLDPGTDRYKEQYGVIVICADEADQERVFNELSAQGLNVKIVVT